MTVQIDLPTVYAGLTQDELDRAYDQNHWADDADAIQARIIARSHDIARRMPPQTHRYGPSERQMIDIFAPKDADGAAVFILIHGGAWQLSMRDAFYGAASAITAAGGILAVVGFDCLPEITLIEMAEQVRQATLWVSAEIGAFGGNSRNLHLIGHSSGAHLAAAMLSGGLGPAAQSVRGATLISGLYDMTPVLLSSRRDYVDLTDAQIDTLSPIRNLERFACTVSVWWGSHESPEFKRQSRDFANALHGRGCLGQASMLAGRNHFEMLEELEDPNGPIVSAMLAAAA